MLKSNNTGLSYAELLQWLIISKNVASSEFYKGLKKISPNQVEKLNEAIDNGKSIHAATQTALYLSLEMGMAGDKLLVCLMEDVRARLCLQSCDYLDLIDSANLSKSIQRLSHALQSLEGDEGLIEDLEKVEDVEGLKKQVNRIAAEGKNGLKALRTFNQYLFPMADTALKLRTVDRINAYTEGYTAQAGSMKIASSNLVKSLLAKADDFFDEVDVEGWQNFKVAYEKATSKKDPNNEVVEGLFKKVCAVDADDIAIVQAFLELMLPVPRKMNGLLVGHCTDILELSLLKDCSFADHEWLKEILAQFKIDLGC